VEDVAAAMGSAFSADGANESRLAGGLGLGGVAAGASVNAEVNFAVTAASNPFIATHPFSALIGGLINKIIKFQRGEITLINHTDRPLIVYVSPSPCLKLKVKKVSKEIGADAGNAGVAAGKATVKVEEEYEAPPASIKTTQKKMLAKQEGQPAFEMKVLVEYTMNGKTYTPDLLYVTVVEQENDRFKFIMEECPIKKLEIFNILPRHIEAAEQLPCKYTRKLPVFENGSLVEE
jgi:hypothetical protein